MAPEQAPSLRSRRRAELTERIRAAGHRQLVEAGAAALSLRAVAREVGVAVSALYRYYPSRDELLTDLLVQAFDAQADAVETAAAPARRRGDATGALRAAFTAYRTWSRAHPAEFGLAYGPPVPGYHAPGERTIRAGARVGDHVVALLTEAWDAGRTDEEPARSRGRRLPDTTERQLRELAARRGYRLPLGQLSLAMDALVRIHGFVVMDVFGQLRPISPDTGAWFDDVVAAELSALGLRPHGRRS